MYGLRSFLRNVAVLNFVLCLVLLGGVVVLAINESQPAGITLVVIPSVLFLLQILFALYVMLEDGKKKKPPPVQIEEENEYQIV